MNDHFSEIEKHWDEHVDAAVTLTDKEKEQIYGEVYSQVSDFITNSVRD